MMCSTCKRRPAEIGKACRQCHEYHQQYSKGQRRPGALRALRALMRMSASGRRRSDAAEVSELHQVN